MIIFIVLLLLSPYLILVTKFPSLNLINISEFIAVFQFTTKQALLSAFISTSLGLLVGFSLASIENKKAYKWCELACYIPCFVPVIFVVFSFLNISQLFGFSLSGLFGIVSIHSLINIGLVGVLYSKVILNKSSLSNQLSLVQGISKLDYFFKILIPLTKKDVLFIFSSIFLFCFTSFSIPLIIGGIKSTTLELLIYEKLIISNSVEQAVLIALIQFVFLVIVMLAVNRIDLKNTNAVSLKSSYYKFKGFLLIPIVITVSLVLGLFINFNFSLSGVFDLNLILYSLFIALMAGYAMFIFCQFVFFLLPSKFLEKFLLSYSSPSTVLVGLAFVLLFKESSSLKVLSIFLIYIIIFIPFLYKMFIQSYLENLAPTLKLAKVMGANAFLKFKMISFPLSYNLCLFIAFLTSVWVMGDYAVSSLVLGADSTLALSTKSYMRSYKMNEATNVIFILLLCELVIFLIYKGLLNVSNKKH